MTEIFDQLAAARPDRLDPPGRPPLVLPSARTRGARPLLFAASAALVAAGVAVAFVAFSGSRSPAPSAPAGQPAAAPPAAAQPASAGQLLLAAAEHTDAAAAATGGRYLVVGSESGGTLPTDGGYQVVMKELSQYWFARLPGERSWVIVEPLGAAPASAADRAAWQAHGSPATVHITAPKPFDLSVAAPGKRYGNVIDPRHLFALGDRNASQAELDALPTDPAGLRAALLARYKGGGGDMPTDRNQWLYSVASSVLIDLTVSGAVRSAAYQVLAGLPGVRAIGAVTDERGRAGQAVATTQRLGDEGTFEVRLVFDPQTGAPLAREYRAIAPAGRSSWLKPGQLSSYEVVLAPQTTDDNPPPVSP
jgi:hypothetical protein